MTVKELMAILMNCDPDMEVVFEDTYTRSEGWEDGCDDAVLPVGDVEVENDQVVFYGA